MSRHLSGLTAKMAAVEWFDCDNNVTGLLLAPRRKLKAYFFKTYFAGL